MAADLGTMNQLERMGSELRCPICLSLYKTAATIACNHTFCRSCILESMRSNSSCPVCKTRTSRREVRPSPQMDSLVEIFRGMESATGVTLFPTQACPDAPLQGRGNARAHKGPPRNSAKAIGKKVGGKFVDSRKRPREVELSDSGDGSEDGERVQFGRTVTKASSLDPPKGLVLAKKRVQLRQTPTCNLFVDLNVQSGEGSPGSNARARFTNADLLEYRPSHSCLVNQPSSDPTESSSRSGLSLDLPRSSAMAALHHPPGLVPEAPDLKDPDAASILNLEKELQDFPSLRKAFNDIPQLTPFFWIPNEVRLSQDEPPTQTQLSAQPVRPTFSDLKDSDDESEFLDDAQHPFSARERQHGVTEEYDSDTFEWTQRPSSPELSCTPTKFGLQGSGTSSMLEDYAAKPPDTAICRSAGPVDDTNKLTANKTVLKRGDRIMTSGTNRNTRILPQDEPKMDMGVQGRSSNAREDDGHAPRTFPRLPDVSVARKIDDSSKALGRTDSQQQSHLNCAVAAKRCFGYLSGTVTETEPILPPVSRSEPSKVGFEPEGTDQLSTGGKPLVHAVQQSLACKFCGGTGNSEVAGEMKRYPAGTLKDRYVLVHKLCAEWAPNVYFEEDDCPKNLASEIARGGRIKCMICGKKGAALGCCNNKCKNSYHYPCARRLEGCQWKEDDFVMFCPQHTRSKAPKVVRQCGGNTNSNSNVEKQQPVGNAVGQTTGRSKRRNVTTSEGYQNSKWSPGPALKWVLCGSGLDSARKAQLASFAGVVGATLVKDWSPAVTHVITGTDERGAAKRTLKYLLAMLEGKWIVKLEWMNECLVKKQPLAEEPYLVTCDVNGFFGGPCLSRHLAVSKASKLFDGVSFYLCGEFTSLLKSDIQSLIVAGGGVVLQRKPLPQSRCSLDEVPSVSREAPRPGETVVLYSGENDPTKGRNLASRIQEAMAVSLLSGAHALPSSWLLDSIAHCRLLPH